MGWFSIIFTPLSIPSTVICHCTPSILICMLQTDGGIQRKCKIPEDEDILSNVMSTHSRGYTGFRNVYLRWITCFKFYWQHGRLASIYDNWQSIFDDLPDALNAVCYNGWSLTNSY
jgi:hypothetical protein